MAQTSSFGQMIGKSIKGFAGQVGAAANGFSKELGLAAPGGSIGENIGKYTAKTVAAPFRFAKDIVSGMSSEESATARPEMPVDTHHHHVSYGE